MIRESFYLFVCCLPQHAEACKILNVDLGVSDSGVHKSIYCIIGNAAAKGIFSEIQDALNSSETVPSKLLFLCFTLPFLLVFVLVCPSFVPQFELKAPNESLTEKYEIMTL